MLKIKSFSQTLHFVTNNNERSIRDEENKKDIVMHLLHERKLRDLWLFYEIATCVNCINNVDHTFDINVYTYIACVNDVAIAAVKKIL
jgi:hypothetical protein